MIFLKKIPERPLTNYPLNRYMSSVDSEPIWMVSFCSSGVWPSTFSTFTRNSSSLYLWPFFQFIYPCFFGYRVNDYQV